MASTFRTTPSQQSQFAISNVHRATQAYFESLDKRLKVETSFNGHGTSFIIKANAEVPLTMTWTAVEHDKAVKDFEAMLEGGQSVTLELTAFSIADSPVFDEILSSRGVPSRLQISPVGLPVQAKVSVDDGAEGYVELGVGDGELTYGNKRATVKASFFQELVSVRITRPLIQSSTDRSSFNLSINFDRWNSIDLRLLREFESVARLLSEAEKHGHMNFELYVNGKQIQERISLQGHEEFLRVNHYWVRFVVMARKVAQAFNLSVPFDTTHSLTQEQFLALFEIVETLEGRRTKESIAADSVTLSAEIHKEAFFETDRVSVMTDYNVGKRPTLELFGHEVVLPTVVISVQGDGSLTRVGRYVVGDVAEIEMRREDIRELSFAFNKTEVAEIRPLPERRQVAEEESPKPASAAGGGK